MAERLSFKIDLSTSAAEQKMKKWLQMVSADAKKVQKEMQKALDPPKTTTTSSDKEWKRIQKEREKSRNRQIKDADRAAKNEKSNAQALEKAYKQAWKKIEKAAESAGVVGQQAAQKALDTLKRLKNSPIMRDAEMLRNFAESKAGVIGSTASAADEKADQRRLDQANDRRLKDEKKINAAIVTARGQMNARITSAALISEETRVRLAAEAAAAMNAIEANRAGKDIATVQAEVAAEIAANKQRTAAAVADANRLRQVELQRVTAGNRLNMVIFQSQQAIEDFQFAGFRGVSNNLALMASMLGGNAGIAAMAGLAAISLTQMYLTMREGNKSVETARERVESLLNSLHELRDFRAKEFTDVGKEDTLGIAGDLTGTQKQLRQVEADIQRVMDKKEELDRQASIAGEAAGFRKGFLGEAVVSAINFDLPAFVEESIKRMERYVPLVEEISQETNGAIKNFEELTEAAKSLKDKATESSDELEKLKIQLEALKGIEQQAQGLQKISKEIEKLADYSLDGIMGDFGDFNGNRQIKDFADSLDEMLTGQAESAIEERIDRDTTALEKLQEAYAKALEAENFKEAEDILGQMNTRLRQQKLEVEDINAHYEQMLMDENERLTKLAEVADKEQEVRKEIEKQLELTEERIKKEREKIALLREQKQASREAAESDVFGARQTIVGREADEFKDKISKQADAYRTLIERYKEANKHNPFAQARAKAMLAAVDRREQAIHRRADDRRKAMERQMLDEREGVLSKRADHELAQAHTAAGQGEFAKAERLIQKHRQTLEELRKLQLDQVSNRPINEAKDALARSQHSQRRIEGGFDVEIGFAEKQKQEEEARAQKMREQLTSLDQLKAQLEDRRVISDTDLMGAQNMLQMLERMLEIKNQIVTDQEFQDSVAMSGSSANPLNVNDPRGVLSQPAGPQIASTGSSSTVTNNTTNFGHVTVTQPTGNTREEILRAAFAAKNARVRSA